MAVGLCNEALMRRATSAQGSAAIIARIAEHTTDVRVAIVLKLCAAVIPSLRAGQARTAAKGRRVAAG